MSASRVVFRRLQMSSEQSCYSHLIGWTELKILWRLIRLMSAHLTDEQMQDVLDEVDQWTERRIGEYPTDC